MIRIRRIAAPDLSTIHRRMEQTMETLIRGLGHLAVTRGFVPRADIHEIAAGMLVTLDLGGVPRDAIEIVIEGEFIRVSGVRREPEVGDCLRWHQMEIAYGPFERVFALPPEADVDAISATFQDGFLQITVPRRAGGGRQVPVDVS
ncbi:MAG TPA: Hsp20/alpha crystallin family protein [Patescibacteria group bacterium]|nr:Hsp20/alpha crystallin family protein [Patescibacteria group bacterium]